MAGKIDRVVPLERLPDFQVADGDPDVRGWDVFASDGRKMGEVDQLLIDPGAMKVRYLDVAVDDGVTTERRDTHVLIPIGHARLDESEDHVFVDSVRSADVAALPVYARGPVTREFETEVRTRFDGSYAEGRDDSDFYAHDLYDQDRFYQNRRTENRRTASTDAARLTLSEEELAVGKRERTAGEVEIEKDVETRRVRESIPLKHERVVVERRPATPGMATDARIEEGEIRIPVTEEELVVEKRTVPTEELVVKKQDVVEHETVEAELRRERAEVRRDGDVDFRDGR